MTVRRGDESRRRRGRDVDIPWRRDAAAATWTFGENESRRDVAATPTADAAARNENEEKMKTRTTPAANAAKTVSANGHRRYKLDTKERARRAAAFKDCGPRRSPAKAASAEKPPWHVRSKRFSPAATPDRRPAPRRATSSATTAPDDVFDLLADGDSIRDVSPPPTVEKRPARRRRGGNTSRRLLDARFLAWIAPREADLGAAAGRDADIPRGDRTDEDRRPATSERTSSLECVGPRSSRGGSRRRRGARCGYSEGRPNGRRSAAADEREDELTG